MINGHIITLNKNGSIIFLLIMSYITVFTLFYIPFSFKLVGKRKKRRIEKRNKLQKKNPFAVYWDLFFQISSTFKPKNALFQEDRSVWLHSCKLLVLTYFIFSFVSQSSGFTLPSLMQ